MKVALNMRNSSMTEVEMNRYLQSEPVFRDYKVTKCRELIYVNFSHHMFTCECEIENTRTGKMVTSDDIAHYVMNSIARMKRNPIDEEKVIDVTISVVDIDNTLADNEHRVHLIKQDKPDWDAFFLECDKDTPMIPNIERIKNEIKDVVYVVFLTGRSEICYDKTKAWLDENFCKASKEHIFFSLNYYNIFMRRLNDFSPDSELKPALLFSFMEQVESATRQTYHNPDAEVRINVKAIYDDSDTVIEEFRRLGHNVVDVKTNDWKNTCGIMKLNMVGTGNIFSDTKKDSFGYMLVNKTLVLVDAGAGALDIVKTFIKEGKIDNIIACVTHTHPDHVCDLMKICYYVYFATKINMTIFDYDTDRLLGLNLDGNTVTHVMSEDMKVCTVRNLMKVSGVTDEFTSNNFDWHSRIRILDDSQTISLKREDDTTLRIGSIKQTHRGVDLAKGYVFVNETISDMIVYSGDTNDTYSVKTALDTCDSPLKTLSVYHEASIHKTVAHTHISEVLMLFDDIVKNPKYANTELRLYLYHLEDNVSKDEFFGEEFKHLIDVVTIL